MFEVELPKDNSPVDNTNITTFQLFFSQEQHKEFKELCKQGMVKMYPFTFAEENVNDFLLELVRLYNNKL